MKTDYKGLVYKNYQELCRADFETILDKKFGVMAGVSNGNIVPVPLKEVAGKLKKISKDEQLVQQAKSLGICIGV